MRPRHVLTFPAPHPRRSAAVLGDSFHRASTSGVKRLFRRCRKEAPPCSAGSGPRRQLSGVGVGKCHGSTRPPDYPAPGGTRVRSWPIPFRCPPSSPSVPVWDALRTPGFHFLSYNFTNLIQRSFNESKITNVTLRERKKAAELLQDEVSLTEHSKTIKNEL